MYLLLFDPNVLLALKIAFCAIVGDAVITWILTISNDTFDSGQILKFVKTSLLPYMGTLVVLALLTLVDEGYMPVFYALSTIVVGAFGYEAIREKLTKFFVQKEVKN